jgi:hypothetical protein
MPKLSWIRHETGTIPLSFVLSLWFVGVSVPLATLAAQRDLEQALGGDTTIVHVLVAGCECSQAVAEHLVGRGADRSEREQVWIVGEFGSLRERLARAGYRTYAASADQIRETLGIEAAPLLLIYERGGAAVLYAGGYSPQRPTRPEDVRVAAIVSAARAGKSPTPFPVYRCVDETRPRGRVNLTAA